MRHSLICLSALFLFGCGESNSPTKKAKAPAKVEKLPNETELAQLTLTPKAWERLGIQIKPIVRKKVKRFRTINGEVMIPTGKTVLVSSPIAGLLQKPKDQKIPLPGTHVKKGQKLFTLQPLLTPERDVPTPAERAMIANAKATIASLRLIAEGDVKQSQAQVDGARIVLKRAEQLLKDKAGSERDRDNAQIALNVAERTLEAAKERFKLMSELSVDAKTGQAKPLDLVAPRSGILNRVMVAEGQTIAQGATLFEVVELDKVWIRAPIYVGDQARLSLKASARIRGLISEKEELGKPAEPIQAPPSADPIAVTMDLYYEMGNLDGKLRPGERVRVSIPMLDAEESPVVPWSAILYDIHGNTWVYEQIKPQVVRRQRVRVRYVVDDLAVLAEGPSISTPIVVEGAAELFGTEFGIGK